MKGSWVPLLRRHDHDNHINRANNAVVDHAGESAHGAGGLDAKGIAGFDAETSSREHVDLPLESMYLVSPELPLIKKRWTRWEGRIVLSARPENDLCVSGPTTIKVLGEQVTLLANRILGGKSAPAHVGDRAIVMIDPRAIRIVSAGALAKPSLPVFSQPPVPSGKVRLFGVIKTTRPSNTGLFVTVQIGHAVVSAHVTGAKATADCWPVGGRIALTIGEHDPSVQSLAMPMPPQPCL